MHVCFDCSTFMFALLATPQSAPKILMQVARLTDPAHRPVQYCQSKKVVNPDTVGISNQPMPHSERKYITCNGSTVVSKALRK